MVAVAIGAFAWQRRLVTITVVCLVFFIPVLGLGSYVVHPAHVPPAGLFVLAAVISTLVGAGALIVALRSPQVPFRRPAYFYLLALGAAIVGSASLAAIWAPEFAVADIVVNLGWALAWLPRVSGQLTSRRASI